MRRETKKAQNKVNPLRLILCVTVCIDSPAVRHVFPRFLACYVREIPKLSLA